MSSCLHCGAATANPKYDGRSCANRVNGHKYPSRQCVARSCRHCGTALFTRRTTCDSCNPSFVDWQTVPLQTLRAKALQQYAAQLCSLAREAHRKSSRPTKCAACGYATHYEVCYIKAANEFLPTDFVASVNELSNLVALCPNHHREFDHGYLSATFILNLTGVGMGRDK